MIPTDPFKSFGKWRPSKLKRGRRIRTIKQLADVIAIKRSLWFSPKNGPVPCAIVQNWQLCRCIQYITAGMLHEVRR